MSTCNLLDLETLGSQPIMPKNLSDHRIEPCGSQRKKCHLQKQMTEIIFNKQNPPKVIIILH